MSAAMNIGQAAAASGVSAKMIRYYESIGLMPAASRTDSGYRTYGEAEVNTLRFIRRARDLGFPVESIRQLLDLWRDRARSSSEVRALAEEQVASLALRIAELEAMRRTLLHLVHACHGDGRPDCPILDDLSTEPSPSAAPESRRPASRRRGPPSAPGRRGAAGRRSAGPPAGHRS